MSRLKNGPKMGTQAEIKSRTLAEQAHPNTSVTFMASMVRRSYQKFFKALNYYGIFDSCSLLSNSGRRVG